MKLRIWAMLLALVTIASTFAACGGGVDTTQSTDVIEPNDTNTPDTDAPDVDTQDPNRPTVKPAQETEAPETNVQVSEEIPDDGSATAEAILTLDFENASTVADYLASVNGTSINEKLNGGEIVDGKWKYNEKPLAFSDECGIFDLKSYSLEFDMCFNSFVNKDNTSVFTFITDDDGVLGGDSSFYQLKMDSDGKLYHFNLETSVIQIEKGKVYHVRYSINRENQKASIYIDGSLWVSVGYSQENRAYNCFRFMDSARGADMWLDNFVVKDLEAVAGKSTEDKAVAIEAAYVRGGKYANEPQKLAGGKYIDIKHHSSSMDVYRVGLIKFDISALKPGSVNYTRLTGNYVNMNADRTFDIYWIDSDWSSETVTFNNVPKGTLIAKGVTIGGVGAPLEVSKYIEEALANGDKVFSIKIVPTFQTGDGQTRIYYDGENIPTIQIFDEKPTKNYFEKLVSDPEANTSIWIWAQKMYDQWYDRYQSLPAVNSNAQIIAPDYTQYIKTNFASGNAGNYATTKKEYDTRPLEGITDLDNYVSDEFKNAELDMYGGIKIESLKHKATGYFYTVKIDGRWWMIDPLGYPYINIGLSHIDYSLNGSKLQKETALKIYGTYENWALQSTNQVRDELNFNSTFSPRSEVKNIAGGLPYMAHFGVMSSYGSAKAVRGDGNGSTVFTENNTMPVFDPDFVGYAINYIENKLSSDVNNAKIIGYTSDNELPMDVAMLDNALTVNHTNPANFYTYACAWTWLCNMTGNENPSYDDVTDELRDLYRGFVYDRYFYVVSNAIKSVDPNHMYMGCRFLTKVNESEWVYRFAAQYLDCMTINWYFCWEPASSDLYGIEKNGDMPFVVTEFYTKAGDSGLPNMSGAGWYVATQTDRADFYETFTIKMLESNNCVGWQLFHYMDNDPNSGTSDASSVDSNKGIYNNNYELYTDFTDRIKVLNANVYKLLDYFKNK